MGGRVGLRGRPSRGGRNVPPADARMARVTGDRVRLHGAAGTVPSHATMPADPAANARMARVTGDPVRLHGATGTVPTDARRSADPARDSTIQPVPLFSPTLHLHRTVASSPMGRRRPSSFDFAPLLH